jgi:hypothetical protein
MSNTEDAIIKQVLEAIEVKSTNPRCGTLNVTQTAPLTTGQEALAEFQAISGPGWLQEAGTREILHGDAQTFDEQIRKLAPQKAWPVAGERASSDGKKSLHLRRCAKGWIITTLERIESNSQTPSDNCILLTQRLLGSDLKQYLVYEVAYTLETIGGHKELRPFASRFIGFEEIELKTDEAQPSHAQSNS